jgi:hypothetical protein
MNIQFHQSRQVTDEQVRSLTIRKLIFGHDALDLVGLDAVSKSSVCLDGQASNDGVNPRLFDLHPSLRTLTAMKDGIVQPVDM